MKPLVLAILLAFTLAGATVAISWQTATVSIPATKALRALIAGEHERICGEPIAHDPQLKWVARWKAMDMGLRDSLSHQTVDGKRTWDFYATAGIPFPYGAGEVLGVNTFSLAETAQAVFDGWLASPGHAALIQNCDYDRFGVGAYRTGDKKWYAVEFTNVRR